MMVTDLYERVARWELVPDPVVIYSIAFWHGYTAWISLVYIMNDMKY